MARWANIVAGAVDHFREIPDGQIPDPNPAKGFDLRIVVESPEPNYDHTTHVLDPSTPTYTVNPTDVTMVWNLRAKTQAELDADKAQAVNDEVSSYQTGRYRIVGELIWEVARAANTGDWSNFVIDDGVGGTRPVASKADFIQYVREKSESTL